MTDTDPIPDLDPQDREVAALLAAERPAASARFRGELGRLLRDRNPGYGSRPANLRFQVIALIGCGAALMLLGGVASGSVL